MTMADNPMSIFDISGRAMSAQLMRLNTTASNLAKLKSSLESSRLTGQGLPNALRKLTV